METSWSSTCIMIQAPNEFLPNMKVEDLVLPFSKSPRTPKSHEWFARYDHFIFTFSWTSKGHISWFLWPNLMGFFPTNHIFPPLSKNINIMYQNLANQNGIFWLVSFKIQVWPIFDFCDLSVYTHFGHLGLIGIGICSMTKAQIEQHSTIYLPCALS